MSDPHDPPSGSQTPPEEHDTLPPSMDPALLAGVEEPPRDLWGIARRLGPGLIIAGSIVGSGELIATTKTGAQAGIVLLWLIIVGCLIKVFVQIELGRYTIGHGETTLAALDQVPGPRLKVGWIVWFWLLMMLLGIGQLGGIVGGVGQAAALALPVTGDYADAVLMPSTDELKRYARWDRELLSEWELVRYLKWREAVDSSAAKPAHFDQQEWEWIVAGVHSTRRRLESAGFLENESGRKPGSGQKPGFSEKAGLLDVQRSILEPARRLHELHERDTAAGADLREAEAIRRTLNAQLLPLNEGALAGQSVPDAQSIRDAAGLNERERRRLIRGHEVLSAQLAEIDRDGRATEAIVAVNKLIDLEQVQKRLEEQVAALRQSGAAEAELREARQNARIAAIRVESQKQIVNIYVEPGTTDDKLWAVLAALFTAGLLYRGRYRMIQNVSTALVVMFTFITIGNALSLQSTQQWRIGASQFFEGLSFRLPESSGGINPLVTALATFGIIGVGASELIAYPYWCLEKGYAKFTGRRTADESWARRARGWMKVMRCDAFASMVIYTIATVAFFLMGVAVLYNEGRDPEGMRMVSTLARAYVPVFGEYARWLFLAGAIAVLYSTFMVANAGHARVYTDALKVFGLMDKHNQVAHDRSVGAFSLGLPLLCAAVYCSGIDPVRAILLSGAMQALLLPMIGTGALYFRYTRTDGRIKPGPVWDALLVVSFLGLFVAGTYGAYGQIVKLF